MLVNRSVYLSGVLGVDTKTQKLVDGGAVAETRQALINMGHILKEAGSSYDKGHIYLPILYCYKQIVQVKNLTHKLLTSAFSVIVILTPLLDLQIE